jgi:hypothetical protein
MIPMIKMAAKDNERVFLILAMYSSDISNEHKIIDPCYYAVRMHCISLHTYCLLIKRILEKTCQRCSSYKASCKTYVAYFLSRIISF